MLRPAPPLPGANAAFTSPRWRSRRLFAKLAAMRSAFAIAALAAVAASPCARAAAETYRFDPVHTQVWFSVAHQGFSHPLGRLRIKDGWFAFDEADWSASRVDVVIDLASVDLGDAKWNEAARAGSLLDVERWPVARYVSQRVEKTSGDGGTIHGELHFRGEVRPVDIAFRLNRLGNDPYAFNRKAGFSASATFQRSAFGMTRYAGVVGEDVSLRLEIEGIRGRDTADPKHKEP